jgi:hypothetical protein
METAEGRFRIHFGEILVFPAQYRWCRLRAGLRGMICVRGGLGLDHYLQSDSVVALLRFLLTCYTPQLPTEAVYTSPSHSRNWRKQESRDISAYVFCTFRKTFELVSRVVGSHP